MMMMRFFGNEWNIKEACWSCDDHVTGHVTVMRPVCSDLVDVMMSHGITMTALFYLDVGS